MRHLRPTPYRLVLVTLAAWLAIGFVSGHAAALNVASQALTPYRTCTVTATPSSTTAVLDASVRLATPTTNVGTVTTDNVASATGGQPPRCT